MIGSIALAILLTIVVGIDPNKRLSSNLAVTPPMGWNSYNHYSCYPNQAIIQSNAQALVDLGLSRLGYVYVTTDCGWATQDRNSNGTIQWDSELFPDGFPALGQYIHALGLKFGVYSDAGIQMCSTGQNISGSLYHEADDANTFASWGADLLKYDNCYSDEELGYPNVVYAPSTSPQSRYTTMANALAASGREILLAICEWGVSFPSNWAPGLGNTWRITNDIIPQWSTVYRQINQVVPNVPFAAPGQWPDLDMLEVGNNVFTTPEEQTHFTLWAICKSPLVIGAALKDSSNSISNASLAILSNADVIAMNQDSLGIAASLQRRYTEEQYDIWAGKLSGGRMVAALVNWADESRVLHLDLPEFGLQYASSAKDVWNNKTVKHIRTSHKVQVEAHGTALFELKGVTAAGHYDATKFAKANSYVPQPIGRRAHDANLTFRKSIVFSHIYGITNSPLYKLQITFENTSAVAQTIQVKTSASSSSITVHVPANSKSVSAIVALHIGRRNNIFIKSSHPVTAIDVQNPVGTFYGAPSFNVQGDAVHVNCTVGTCQPIGAKIGYLTPNGNATITIARNISTAATTKYLKLVYCNNDIAFGSAFSNGRNARNITIGVNGNIPVRLEVPLSGNTSELFSPDGGFYDCASLGLLVDGFGVGAGSDEIVVSNYNGNAGVQFYGADFVGFTIY